MHLTAEQIAIINSTGNIKINAVAGSGKTTTVVEYAKARPKDSKILYLAFNKSVKLEAVKKFKDKGLDNVKVETAHSLAYKNVVFKHKYKVRPQEYSIHEIVELLNLQGNEERLTEYVIANHINKFITYFCNSDKQKVQDLNYLDIVYDRAAKSFVKTFYSYIETQCRILLGKMDKGEIDVTHSFYLKKFQLSNPRLQYDYILFDEGQDASAVMLDVFFKQKATKVIVGDTYQQIYGWRHAVNSLEQANYTNYNLTMSFRFGQDVANLAKEVLKLKSHLGEFNPINITGNGETKIYKSKGVLARTNLGLLKKAIEYVTEKKKVKHIYFEGNINSYTYADEGASLYDVLNLYNGFHYKIKDKLLKSMKDIEELEDYVEKTEDVQLGMMVEIVNDYGNEIPGILKAIKDKHVGDDEKDKAEMIFSTVHRCKGLEYDAIQLANDFITEEKLLELLKDSKKEGVNFSKLNEEINLLYVAITRTRNSIHIPETLMPVEFPKSSHIHIMQVEKEEKNKRSEKIEKAGFSSNQSMEKKEKAYSVKKIREKHKDAYNPWTEEQDEELTEMYCNGESVLDISIHLGRTKGAIYSRIRKLELEDLYG